ncbi:chitinase [Sporothrix schenckii 1099-18]|uniref:chitinase n=1 Tax=Sporothrix schenckii 1099-18 TaxID=1397361 RepID=A0A0F2M9R2_SPOSC|nr:chitinase [Sporothrix schenckii 1099-18]KJR84901.1 chitinase [Sporothrix schenckii 1099-18]
MLFFHGDLAVLVALSCFATTVAGSFSSSGADNIAIYWGQNSHGAATGTSNAQQRLSFYCSNAQVDIIPLAFLNVISSPSVNFANAGDNCTAFSGSTLLGCSQLEEDIQTCQSKYGKTIMLSVGGATYTEGGFRSSIAATSAADNIWAMFGPVQSNGTVNRPFGKAVVDGFDFDFESSSSNMAPFASALRSKMDVATAAGDKPYYLSAAPQCPYPDAADKDMLAGSVYFDFVMVQFYNNYCGLPSFVYAASKQNSFNFDTWDRWAKTSSKNPNVRVLLGIPGSSTAAGTGYTAGSSLTSIISYCKQFASFGGRSGPRLGNIHAFHSGKYNGRGDGYHESLGGADGHHVNDTFICYDRYGFNLANADYKIDDTQTNFWNGTANNFFDNHNKCRERNSIEWTHIKFLPCDSNKYRCVPPHVLECNSESDQVGHWLRCRHLDSALIGADKKCYAGPAVEAVWWYWLQRSDAMPSAFHLCAEQRLVGRVPVEFSYEYAELATK